MIRRDDLEQARRRVDDARIIRSSIERVLVAMRGMQDQRPVDDEEIETLQATMSQVKLAERSLRELERRAGIEGTDDPGPPAPMPLRSRAARLVETLERVFTAGDTPTDDRRRCALDVIQIELERALAGEAD